MNKSELAERLAGRTGMSKVAAKDAVDGVFETIAASTVPVFKAAKTLKDVVGSEASSTVAPNRVLATRGASEGQDIECTRLRHDDRRCRPILAADWRIEAWFGVAAVSPAEASALRQNYQIGD